MVIGVGVERAAIRLGEHPSFVVPELAGGFTFGCLLLLVDLEQDDNGIGQPDDSTAGP